MGRVFLALISTLFLVTQVMAGAWTSNNFLYKPAVGARGTEEKARFDSGLDRVDSRLANEKWLNDAIYGGDLGTAVTTIGTANAVLSIPAGTWSISENLTVPANLTLRFAQGALLNIAAGKTLTINGPIDAGPYQIISDLSGGKAVVGTGAVKEILPQWWGAKGDNATDCTAAIQAALDAVPVGGTVRFVDGIYRTGPLALAKSGVKLQGSSGYGSNRTPGPTGTTLLVARGNQTHLLTIGDLSLSYKICDVVVEDLNLNGGGYTLSTGVLVLKNMAGAHFHRLGLGGVVGRALHLEDFWDSTFNKCFIHDAGVPGDCTVYIAPRYSPEYGGRNVNDINFNECAFESNQGHCFASQDFAGGGDNSLDILRLLHCKFEIGSGTSTHATHKSAIYLPYMSRLIVTGNTFTNFTTEAGYDHLIEVGGYYGSGGPVITGNSIADPLTGTPPNFVSLLADCPPAIIRNNTRSVGGNYYSTFVNRSTSPQPFLEPATAPKPIGLSTPKDFPLWKSAHLLGTDTSIQAFVYDADALSKQQTVCSMSTDWTLLGLDKSRDFLGYKYNIIVRARVKKGAGGTDAVCNLCYNWNEAGSAWLGPKSVTSTSWTWVEWTVTATQLQNLKNLAISTDTMANSPTLYVDGWYYVVTNTAS